MKRVRSGGGLAALRYSLKQARQAGGIVRLTRRLQAKNACKTCAVGMGGQHGGMRNEAGSFPEVCKKSIQAQAADMQPPIDAAFFRGNDIRTLEQWSGRELEQAGRLGFPVVLREGDTHFRRLGWEESYSLVARALADSSPLRTFFYSSGRSSNEAAFLLQCFARVYGTNNVNNCSYYCHQASSVALQKSLGTSTATVALEDLEKADLAVVVGANPASNHPRLITQLVHLRRRGGKVLVINPLKELGLVRFRVPSDWRSMMFGSDVSDIYLQPHVGADVAVLKLLLKRIVDGGYCDRAFLEAHVNGWSAVEEDVRREPEAALLEAGGVPLAAIDAAARLLIESHSTIFAWAMGITQHAHGVDNVQAIINLALARGMIGKPGAGLLPIRGHSNVQGVGSVGFAPSLKAEFLRRLEQLYDVRLPSTPGLHTLASLEAAANGDIDVAFLLGGNLFSASPDSEWSRKALQKVGLTVYVTTKLNAGHIHGRGKVCVLLPALARDEESQCTTQESMFSYVRVSSGGAQPLSGEMRAETEMIAEIAGRVLPSGPVDFASLRDHAELRAAMAAVVPGYEAIGEVDRGGSELVIPGRTLHAPRFASADGRAQAVVTPLSTLTVEDGEMRLMTLRSEGQFNTVVYEDEDLYRGNERRDVVMMCKADAQRLGLVRDQSVVVLSSAGEMTALVRFADLPPGNLAMYYPEANVLVPRRIDSQSGTPVFKSVAVRLEVRRG